MRDGDITVPNAHFVGFWLMLLLTGIYLTFLPQFVRILRQKWADGNLPLWIPLASATFFVLFFLHLAIEMARVWEAFSMHGTQPSNPAVYYSNVRTTLSLLKNGIAPPTVMFSDSIIVYRTFVIWRNTNTPWVPFLPLALLLAGVGTGIWAIWTLAQTKTGDVLIFATVTHRVRIFFIITFVLNVLCSGLIGWKLWFISSRVTGGQNVYLSTGKVLSIIIESAAMYCALQFALIVTSLAGTNVFFIFLDPLPQVTAIVFTLLIVRVASEGRKAQDSSSRGYPTLSTFDASRRRTQLSTIGVEIDLDNMGETETDDRTLNTADRPFSGAFTEYSGTTARTRTDQADKDKIDSPV